MPLLFSYGTLRQDDVQLATFGRLLEGRQDYLLGYELSDVEIGDAVVEKAVGATHYANLIHTGREDTRVRGMVFEITDAELAAADAYEERARYTRIPQELASGRTAWIYVCAG